MTNVMKACIIMNNLVVERRRDNYESYLWRLATSTIGRNAVLIATVIKYGSSFLRHMVQLEMRQARRPC